MTELNCRQYGHHLWSISSTSRRGRVKVGGWGQSLFESARSFTLLEYIKIWSNIQVIIYRLIVPF